MIYEIKQEASHIIFICYSLKFVNLIDLFNRPTCNKLKIVQY